MYYQSKLPAALSPGNNTWEISGLKFRQKSITIEKDFFFGSGFEKRGGKKI
jgi:hypothetical protein